MGWIIAILNIVLIVLTYCRHCVKVEPQLYFWTDNNKERDQKTCLTIVCYLHCSTSFPLSKAFVTPSSSFWWRTCPLKTREFPYWLKALALEIPRQYWNEDKFSLRKSNEDWMYCQSSAKVQSTISSIWNFTGHKHQSPGIQSGNYLWVWVQNNLAQAQPNLKIRLNSA